VAVRVELTPFSPIVDGPALKLTVGALSSSVIMILACCVPFSVAPPPETFVISASMVSLP